MNTRELQKMQGVYVWQTVIHCSNSKNGFTLTLENSNYHTLCAKVCQKIYEKTKIQGFQVS